MRKNSNANGLQIFAYFEQIVSDKVEANLNEVGKLLNVSGIPLTMWGTNLNEDAYYFTISKKLVSQSIF